MPAVERCHHRCSEGGFAIVFALFLVTVLGGLVFATFHEGLGQRAAVEHVETSVRALETAETGLLLSEMEIRTQQDPDGDGIGTVTGMHAGGTYEVEAQQHADRPDHYTQTALGSHRLSVRRVEVELRRIPRMPFLHALFAKNDILVAGSVTTDSFDSRLGTWADQAVNSDGGGAYAAGGGDVGSNGNIHLGGSAQTIRGDARPGPLGAFTADGNPTIWGTTKERDQIEDVPDLPIEEYLDAWAHNDNAQLLGADGYDPATWSLKPTGNDKIVLMGGTYFFTDVVFEGGTQLIVKGSARVYVTGNCHLSGGCVLNKTGQPEDLLLLPHPYPVPTGYVREPVLVKHGDPLPQVVLNGGAQTSLAVYGPSADILLTGTAALFGAAVGRNIQVEGSPIFHYDRALGHIDWPGPRDAVRVYWVERTQPPR